MSSPLIILGAGGIGSALGHFFSDKFEVFFFDQRSNRLSHEFFLEGKKVEFPLLPFEKLQTLPNPILIYTTKIYDLEKSWLGQDQTSLFLQNGFLDQKFFGPHSFRGACYFGASLDRESRVLKIHGNLKLSVEKKFHVECKEVFDFLNEKDAVWSLEENKKILEWKKALSNLLINPLATKLGVQNGELLKPENLEVLKKLFFEVKSVARMDGVEFQGEDFDSVLRLIENSKENHNTWIQDQNAGRRSERDAIMGVFLEKAKVHKIHPEEFLKVSSG